MVSSPLLMRASGNIRCAIFQWPYSFYRIFPSTFIIILDFAFSGKSNVIHTSARSQ
jgi:hypothetical protein